MRLRNPLREYTHPPDAQADKSWLTVSDEVGSTAKKRRKVAAVNSMFHVHVCSVVHTTVGCCRMSR